jgi:cytochrome P450
LKTLRDIPGPRGLPILGNVLAYARDPLARQLEWIAEHGDTIRYRLAGQDVVLTIDPDAVRDVFTGKADAFVKGRALQQAKRVVGEGLLTAEGDKHLRARRMLSPIFSPAAIAEHARVMVETTSQHADGWRDGEVRDIAEDMAHSALAIIARVLFRGDVDDETRSIGHALEDALRVVARLTIPIYKLVAWLPLPSHVRFWRARRYLDALMYRLIDDRRKRGGEPTDMLGMLLAARDEEGDQKGLTDEQIRDELITLFLAGHETTANGMAWTFALLAESPEVEAKLVSELKSVLGDRPATLEDLPKLTYTKQVVFESLRLKPPVWNIARRATREVELAGYALPKDTVVIVSPYTSHRQARFFDAPDTFRPERWDGVDPRKTLRGTYFPFAGGKRVCIGEHFALMEMQLMLATVLRRYRLEPAYSSMPAMVPTITIRPQGGLPMTVRPR